MGLTKKAAAATPIPTARRDVMVRSCALLKRFVEALRKSGIFRGDELLQALTIY